MASRLMLGTAVLALPLTASVTYAESLAPAPPAPPAPPAVALMAPTPPAPPAPPAVLGMVQAAPEAPEVQEESEVTIVTVDPDTGETETVDVKTKGKTVYKVKDKKTIVIRDGEGFDAEALRAQLKDMDVDIDIEDLADLEDLKDLEDLRKEMREVMIVNRGGGLEDAEVEVIIKEMREGLAEAREATKLARIELRTLAESDEWKAALKEAEGRTFVTMKCDSSTKDVATTVEREDGATEVIICEKRVMSHALKGLEQARAAIAENDEITGKMRKEILKELDQQIKSWRKDAR